MRKVVETYNLFKNADRAINQILRRFQIKPIKDVKQAIDQRNNYYITRADYQNIDTIFKARLLDQADIATNFQNERFFLKTLTNEYANHPLVKSLPKLVETGDQDAEWLIYKYITGKPLGKDCAKYDNPTKKEIGQIVFILKDIQDFPILELITRHNWAKRINFGRGEDYLAFFQIKTQEYKEDLAVCLTNELIQKGEQIIREGKHILDQNCRVLAHGDFHPANMIQNRRIGPKIIDWEKLRVDNSANDPALLWFRMANSKKNVQMRQFFLKEFAQVTSQKEDFDQLFRLNVIMRMPSELERWIVRMKTTPPASIYHRVAKKVIEVHLSSYSLALEGAKTTEYQ